MDSPENQLISDYFHSGMSKEIEENEKAIPRMESACGKSFNKEDDLENHIANRHKDLFEPEDFSVCLADYCDILRCSTQRSVRRRPWTYRPQHDLQTFQVAKAPSKELVALLESSESFSSPATLRQTRSCRDGSCRDGSCQDGSCQGGSCKDGSCRGFHESGSTEIKSSKTVSRLSENSTECLSCSVAPPRCDRNKMREMKEKCVKLIDTCVNHMSLFLSDAKFEELRERMSSRVCWYLTCERYWDNQQRRRHSQPTGLFIVFIAVAVIYFTFSYYIVWGCF
ncbi:uncharacterized protein LOC111711073 [Eurytemora carolleeae]|uniref:uncharacterized protein LOC111711073 n=1 Tax=Eurytemora carolleeae TaxID=1294199 RepID=UPI000C779F63|nr:uncharacterized protein LOC111711073 [Eurytemora carolleeae]|eukprot:XP_023341092.1 uncharacterized protein LOC111711073 [Eurytemora affinis]